MKRLLHGLLTALIALPLWASVSLAQDETPTPEERYEALDEKAAEIYATWREAIMEAQKKAAEAKEGEAIPAVPMRPDFSALVPEFQAAASDYAGTDDAVPFLLWLVQNGATAQGANKDALRTLLESHAASEELEDAAYMLREVLSMLGEEEGTRLLKHV